MKKSFKDLFVFTISLMIIVSPVYGAGKSKGVVDDYDFSFEGMFGTYDRDQLRRGLQVFTEVCAGCHGLSKVAYRNLGDIFS